MTDTTSSTHELAPADVERAGKRLAELRDAVAAVVVGQREMVDGLLIGLLTGGHVLLEGVPGLAKTLTVNALASGLDAEFARIQFTPDLLPADLVGTLIYDPREHTFTPRRGPVFANVVLADEINRAPAKVQSALLEAMQERRVTIGDVTYDLPDPFLVLATQNPIEQEGTYPLPEAQVDRFMLKLRIGYPTRDDERTIVDRMTGGAPPAKVVPVLSPIEVRELRDLTRSVRLDTAVRDYIVDLVFATREPATAAASDLARLVEFGASPRASIALALAARARAVLEGRPFVTPSDVKTVAPDVLRHRVIVTYEAEAESVSSDDVVRRVLDTTPVP